MESKAPMVLNVAQVFFLIQKFNVANLRLGRANEAAALLEAQSIFSQF